MKILYAGALLTVVYLLTSLGDAASQALDKVPDLMSKADARQSSPEGVPWKVWRWKPMVQSVIAEVDETTLGWRTTLAMIWRETAGETSTPGTKEKGPLQVLPIAVEDVNENMGASFDWGSMTQREALKAGILYDALNWKRISPDAGVGQWEEKERKVIRSHNEGPPPHTQQAAAQYTRDVLDYRETIRDATTQVAGVATLGTPSVPASEQDLGMTDLPGPAPPSIEDIRSGEWGLA